MTIELPALPWPKDSLAPHISVETLDYHHGKHHQAYVTNGNKLIEGTEFASMSLEAIVKATAGKADKAGIFNNTAQVWNHTFYWQSMKPKPRCTSRRPRCTSATFEASFMRLNIDSPKNTPPSATPYRPPTSRAPCQVSTE